MTDTHLKDIISRFGFRGKVLDGICIEIKEAIRLDTEAERLFCKQIVVDKIKEDKTCPDCLGTTWTKEPGSLLTCRLCNGTGKIEGKGVEGEQFGTGEK